MPFMHLTHKQKNALELEVVPQEARLELTRMIRHACHGGEETEITLIRENEFINLANQVRNGFGRGRWRKRKLRIRRSSCRLSQELENLG
jgi:hypothetical protein